MYQRFSIVDFHSNVQLEPFYSEFSWKFVYFFCVQLKNERISIQVAIYFRETACISLPGESVSINIVLCKSVPIRYSHIFAQWDWNFL